MRSVRVRDASQQEEGELAVATLSDFQDAIVGYMNTATDEAVMRWDDDWREAVREALRLALRDAQEDALAAMGYVSFAASVQGGKVKAWRRAGAQLRAAVESTEVR